MLLQQHLGNCYSKFFNDAKVSKLEQFTKLALQFWRIQHTATLTSTPRSSTQIHQERQEHPDLHRHHVSIMWIQATTKKPCGRCTAQAKPEKNCKTTRLQTCSFSRCPMPSVGRVDEGAEVGRGVCGEKHVFSIDAAL